MFFKQSVHLSSNAISAQEDKKTVPEPIEEVTVPDLPGPPDPPAESGIPNIPSAR